MDTLRICQQCRAPLPADAQGPLCAKCQQTPAGIYSGLPAPAAPPTPPPAAQIAEFFPQLEIYELLGHGGMGMVYKARQLNLDRLVALKILSPELSAQPAFAERFSREAKALARLHHTNIVAVYDFGRAGPYYYFLMEYVDGVDLHTLIQRKELNPAESIRIVVEICRALQFAHDEGIIHRDIKPANILIDKKGRVKMADFGLAKLVASSGQRQPDLTQTTGLMGTPQYMAPEQIEHPSTVDSRADLYSLGVIFYEMLTGELPLGRFPLPSQKSHTDVKLDPVVIRALEKDPQLRYQQASEILGQVEQFSEPAIASARSRKLTTFLQYAIVVALVLAGALAFDVFRLRSKTSQVTEFVTNNITTTNIVTNFVPPPGPFGGRGRGPGPFGTNSFPPPFGGRGRGPGSFGAGLLADEPEGLSLGPWAVTNLVLTSDQVPKVNAIIRDTERQFTQLESRHADRTMDAAGHVHVLVRGIASSESASLADLTRTMWAQLGTVLTPEQLQRAHDQPFEQPLERALLPATRQPITLEIWKDANGTYFLAETRENGRRGGPSETTTTETSKGTNFNLVVPARFRIYWTEDK